MRSLWSLPLLILPLACASNDAMIVRTADDRILSAHDVAEDVAKADVVVLGELHNTPPVHAAHLALIEALHERRPDLVIAMEMFERDTQAAMLQYLGGVIDERAFRANARPPRDYERDYRPVIEFARANGLVVLAANAPRALASRAAKDGVEAVAGNRDVARETTAPEDEYWTAFAAEMKGHPGVTEDKMKHYYASQCLKDDTMAESITDYLASRKDKESKPLVVLICGAMHSNYGRGTVARIRSRAPDLDVRVLSAEAVADLGVGPFAAPRDVGQYVVVTKRAAPERVDEPGAVVTLDDVTPQLQPTPGTEAPKPAPVSAPAAAEEQADPNVRPALGFMPADYNSGDVGVRVGPLREGGPAEKAGMAEGDVIVELAGVEVTDPQQYSDLLDKQKIGSKVAVRVRRGNGEVALQVTIGSRPRNR